jgi:4-amino-4-deoxy-L-arabinose transferase-like glycosyltransferase
VSSRARWLIVAVFAVLPLLGWWGTGLFDLDEGFYAAVVSEMNRRGEWVTPFYNGHPWFEKPILLYWLAKPCLLAFGDAVGPRLPSVLCALAIYALVGWFARKHFGERTAQLSVLLISTSLLMVILGRLMMTDTVLAACLVAAWLFFWESLDESRSRWRAWCGLAVGLGILAKGPVALILFGLVVGWMVVRHPEMRSKFRSGWAGFWAACLVVTATWYVPAYLVNGQLFVQEFLIEQNIGRFTGGDPAHTLGGLASLGLYVPVLLLGMLPWSLWIPQAVIQRKERGLLGSYLATCSVAVFLFFTISGAKLPHYILPVLPPLAILVAAKLSSARWSFKAALAWSVALCVGVNWLQFAYYQGSGQAEAHALARYIRSHRDGMEIALYQLSRREADLGTGTLKVRETSLPSMMLYLDANTLDTESLEDILTLDRPTWLFTRRGRIRPEDFDRAASLGKAIQEVHPPGLTSRAYSIYRILPRP